MSASIIMLLHLIKQADYASYSLVIYDVAPLICRMCSPAYLI